MMVQRTRTILIVYACLSAVYLLFLPYALPGGDDWAFFQMYSQAREGGIRYALHYTRHLLDNTFWGQFRFFWVSFVPNYLLSAVADFAGWPYFLLAWLIHLLTAVLLCRLVSLLTGDAWVGFAAGAVFAVFPAANHVLFTPFANYYYMLLALAAWFYLTWKKLAVSNDYRYRWKDFALLLPVVFTGEQILPAMALLPGPTFWLFGRREERRRFLRFWICHLAVMAAVLVLYTLLINRVPIRQTVGDRYVSSGPWSLRPFHVFLVGSLGLHPKFAGWRAELRPEPALFGLLTLAAVAFFWGRRRSNEKRPAAPLGELLLWSVAGVALTYLPVARLTTFELRYLYVPSLFLITAGIALVSLVKRPIGIALTFLTVCYCLCYTYFEMRQCWIPQSRVAHSIIDAVSEAGPFRPHDVVIFSGVHGVIGMAPSFLTGASWAIDSLLEYSSKAAPIVGARDLLINDRGELSISWPEWTRPVNRNDLPHLHVFVYGSGGRFIPRSLLALPAPDGRFQVLSLQGQSEFSDRTMTLDEIKGLPRFGEIYFPRVLARK